MYVLQCCEFSDMEAFRRLSPSLIPRFFFVFFCSSVYIQYNTRKQKSDATLATLATLLCEEQITSLVPRGGLGTRLVIIF